MALSNVSSFLQTIGQGVKPNMFLVDVRFPDTLSKQTEDLNLTNILCKSAALPGSNLGVIEVPFRGRTVKICLLYTSPSPRDKRQSRMPSSA